MTTATKPTVKELRLEAQRLGITPESAGCPIDDLLRQARENDDPLGYLAIYAPGATDVARVGEEFQTGAREPVAAVRDEILEKMNPAKTEADQSAENLDPIGDVPAPFPGAACDMPAKVSICIPISSASFEGCYINCHLDIRITRSQAETLRRVQLALDGTGATTKNNRRVVNQYDAIRWLLEAIDNNISQKIASLGR